MAAVERVRELCERVADAFVLVDVDVRVEEVDGEVRATFEGGDLACLIGHHGATLEAIQHLAYRAAFRGGNRGRVVVDAGGYRERRAVALRAVADQAVTTAVRDRRPVPLDPMSASERRVVHEYLKDRFDVETYSEGQEPARRLVVAPVVD